MSADRRALEPVVRRLGLLSVAAGLAFVVYAVVLAVVLGPRGSPLPFLAPVEAVIGGLYVLLLYADRRRLAGGPWRPSRLWYLPAFVLGGTVLAAPLFVAVYFWRRRRAVGRPQLGYLAVVRQVVPSVR